MPRALKVYRTPIGFHDAYVAAPSQKAAMEAWGSGKDLFTRGEAELVTDPALTAEPLANPGVVIKRLRGSAAEQIAALGSADKPRQRAQPATKPKPEREPKPSREKLDAAEAAVETARKRQEQELDALAKREAALARERKALEQKQAQEMDALARHREKAEAEYREKMRRWRG